MPFPDGTDGSAAQTFSDPFEGVRTQGEGMLREFGQGRVLDGEQAPGGGWPEGLAPEQVMDRSDATAGLPDYYTDPGGYVPSPEDRDPNDPTGGLRLADPRRAATVDPNIDQLLLSLAAAPSPSMHLADTALAESHKLKCPKCDTVQSAKNKTCINCGHDLTDARKAKFANMSAPTGDVILYQPDQGALKLGVEHEGLIWKIACKTGTLALSPGPGQVDLEVPLVLDDELFASLKESVDEKAFPHITVPETHVNGPLENTGYVRQTEVLTLDQALEDPRVGQKAREVIKDDPADTRYLLCGIEFTEPDVREKAVNGSIPDTSIGVKFGYRNKTTGKTFKAALEHLALTPVPWRDGLPAFGMDQSGVFDAEDQAREFDGVFVPVDEAQLLLAGREPIDRGAPETQTALALGMTISMYNDHWDDPNVDQAKALAALSALSHGDRLSLPLGVSVQRVDDPEDGDTLYLVTEGYEGTPRVARDLDQAGAKLASCLAKAYEREMAMRKQSDARAAPVKGGYDQPGGVDIALADLTSEGRKKSAGKGHALPDGSFPIESVEDLKNAISAFGRAKDKAKAKAHIKARAKALGQESLIPDSWSLASQGDDEGLHLAVTFDPQEHPRDFKGQFKTLVGGLKAGESVSLPDGTRVERKNTPNAADQKYKVYRAKTGNAPAGSVDADSVDAAANGALRQSSSAGKTGELPDSLTSPQNAAAFDPQEHPHDFKDQFRALVGKLKIGESIELPDGQAITRTEHNGEDGFLVKRSHMAGKKPGSDKYEHPSFWSKKAVDNAIHDALVTSESAGKQGELPDTLAEIKKIRNKPAGGTPKPRPGSQGTTAQRASANKKAIIEKAVGPGYTVEIRGRATEITPPGKDSFGRAKDPWMIFSDGGNTTLQDPDGNPAGEFKNFQEAAVKVKTTETGKSQAAGAASTQRRAKAAGEHNRRLHRGGYSQPYGSQDGGQSEGTPLSESDPSGTLWSTLRASATRTNEMTPTDTPTVEEVLAEQQARIERLEAEKAAAEDRLNASQATIGGLQLSVHRDDVARKVTALESAGLPPSVLTRAKLLYMGDVPGTTPELNLSVVGAPVKQQDGTDGTEDKQFKSVSEVVDFLLGGVPTVDNDSARQLATLHASLDLAATTRPEDADSDDAKREQARKLAAQRHPELYNDDGTPKQQAA